MVSVDEVGESVFALIRWDQLPASACRTGSGLRLRSSSKSNLGRRGGRKSAWPDDLDTMAT